MSHSTAPAAPDAVSPWGPDRPRLLKAVDVRLQASQAAAAADQAAETAKILEAARAEGYAAGHRDATAAASAAAVGAGPRLAAALERLASESARMNAEEVDRTGAAVLSTAVEIAGWVLRADPVASSAGLLDRLSVAARALAPGARTVVRVSAADLEAVTGWAREGVEVRADPRLSPGEAVMDRGEGRAELTFSAALRRAARSLGVELAEPEEAVEQGAPGHGDDRNEVAP